MNELAQNAIERARASRRRANEIQDGITAAADRVADLDQFVQQAENEARNMNDHVGDQVEAHMTLEAVIKRSLDIGKNWNDDREKHRRWFSGCLETPGQAGQSHAQDRVKLAELLMFLYSQTHGNEQHRHNIYYIKQVLAKLYGDDHRQEVINLLSKKFKQLIGNHHSIHAGWINFWTPFSKSYYYCPYFKGYNSANIKEHQLKIVVLAKEGLESFAQSKGEEFLRAVSRGITNEINMAPPPNREPPQNPN